jgi:hypothetical protein
MYVHPAVPKLKCAGRLDVVDGLRKPLGHRLVKERQEARYKIAKRSGSGSAVRRGARPQARSGRGARTILYKVVQACIAVVSGSLGGKPAEHGARFRGRWRRVCEEGYGKGGARGREWRGWLDEMVEESSSRGIFERGGGGGLKGWMPVRIVRKDVRERETPPGSERRKSSWCVACERERSREGRGGAMQPGTSGGWRYEGTCTLFA